MTATSSTSTAGRPSEHRSRGRSRLRRTALSLAVVAAVTTSTLLAACSDVEPRPAPPSTDASTGSDATSSPTSTDASATPGPSATAAEPDDASTAGAPPFPADTSPDTADPSQDAMLTVTDVRIGRHDGFDRVVYEMGGRGTPGWTVQYVDQAVQDGSGEVLDLPGDGTLQVLISGSAYPDDSGADPFQSAGPVTGAGTVTVTEARGWSVFEGITDAFIGLQGPGHPFRVYLLESPVRVVVDIADEAS